MSELANERCEACTADSIAVSADDQVQLLSQLPDWQCTQEQGVPMLTASFSFSNYPATLRFVNRVAELAEAADHHPRLVVEWGRVDVAWWTHTIDGLHRNDFIMAARTSAASSDQAE